MYERNLNTEKYWDNVGIEEFENGELRDFHYKFDKILKYVKKGTLIDVGCGMGAFCRRANSSFDGNLSVTGIDFSPQEIKICNKLSRGEKYFVGSVYDIPTQEKYDNVVCSEVLEHLTDLDKAMEELKRIVKPDGVIIITVPLNEEVNKEESEKGNREHIRTLNEESFKKYFKHLAFDYFRSNLIVVGKDAL